MAACLFGASATIASAFPSQTVLCETSGCHPAGAGATVDASLVSTSATTATYNVAMTASAGSAWAVFDGSNRVAGSTASVGAFTVGLGKSYDVFAVDAASSNYVKKSVSPAAPSVEPTASLDEAIPPVTTSDAVGSYVGTAKVTLTATDVGGQGVAYIYYSVDGARVHLFTVGMVAQTFATIAAPSAGSATHTIAFWSQDKAGNVEARTTVTFSVSALASQPSSTSMRATAATIRYGQTVRLWGVVSPNASGGLVTIQRRINTGSWANLTTASINSSSAYTRTISKMSKGTWQFRARYAGTSSVAVSYSPPVRVIVK